LLAAGRRDLLDAPLPEDTPRFRLRARHLLDAVAIRPNGLSRSIAIRNLHASFTNRQPLYSAGEPWISTTPAAISRDFVTGIT